MDLRAHLPAGSMELASLERLLIPTGLYIALPTGYEGQLRPRSGLALRQGLTLLNSPGTIDSDYRGEIQILLINLSSTPATISDGNRIAQLVVSPYTRIQCVACESLDDTQRGNKGFGSTGTH